MSNPIRQLFGGMAWLAAAGCMAGTLVGFAGDWAWWADLLVHFRLQYAWVAALTVLVALLARHWMAATVAGVALAINLAVMAPFLLVLDGSTASGGPDLRVATINLHAHNHNSEAVLDFVTRESPQVVVFEEVSPFWAKTLEVLRPDYPYRVESSRSWWHPVVVYSTLPPLPGPAGPEIIDLPAAALRLDLKGRRVTVVGTHLRAPGTGEAFQHQMAHVEALAAYVNRLAAEGEVIVAGDLNATPWSAPFRRLVELTGLGMGDNGAPATWPTQEPILSIPIDHVLVSDGLKVMGKYRGPKIGSDHYPLAAWIMLGPGRYLPVPALGS